MKRRHITIEVDVPWTLDGVKVAVQAMALLNRMLMREWREYAPVPRLYSSGVRYRPQPPERFRLWTDVMRRQQGDCDQLVSWRLAELWEDGEVGAKPDVAWSPVGMHVRIRRADGSLEDPSEKLGMPPMKG